MRIEKNCHVTQFYHSVTMLLILFIPHNLVSTKYFISEGLCPIQFSLAVTLDFAFTNRSCNAALSFASS